MDEGEVADGSAQLRIGSEILPVRVRIGRPTELSWADWVVPVSVEVGERKYESRPRGSDSLQALLNGLVDAAVEVNRLRQRGSVNYEGRRDDYFCLDELLRRPATGGYLPTEVDRHVEPPDR
ncbi:MAG: hypothetical protein IT303_08485 [Dehalococcoidia bacterium]|nr:hypothetical protein [Dehalococcoidia bacterium]